MMTIKQLFQRIFEDHRTNGGDWTRPGFRALAVYRFGVWRLSKPRIIRFPAYLLYRMLYRFVRNHYGIELSYSTRIGRRFLIGHQGGIVIHPDAESGDDCVIRQNVTIGATRSDRFGEAPRLGHGVEIGAGAVIAGGVKIGDQARIGPNVVIFRDVPARAIITARPPLVFGDPGAVDEPGLEQSSSKSDKGVTT